MYCPLCGNELKLKERSQESRRINDYESDESDWYYCPTNKCFGKDYPIIKHAAPGVRRRQDGYEQPLMHQRSGDSWSLTWLK